MVATRRLPCLAWSPVEVQHGVDSGLYIFARRTQSRAAQRGTAGRLHHDRVGVLLDSCRFLDSRRSAETLARLRGVLPGSFVRVCGERRAPAVCTTIDDNFYSIRVPLRGAASTRTEPNRQPNPARGRPSTGRHSSVGAAGRPSTSLVSIHSTPRLPNGALRIPEAEPRRGRDRRTKGRRLCKLSPCRRRPDGVGMSRNHGRKADDTVRDPASARAHARRARLGESTFTGLMGRAARRKEGVESSSAVQ